MPDHFAYPRPEYPRPDRQRGTLEAYDWLNLNGPWQFRFDPDRQGMTERWFDPGTVQWREQIVVPFCWESLAAWGDGDRACNDSYYSTRVHRNPLEVTADNHRTAARYEVGWYRRPVRVPTREPWHGKRVILTIGAADFFTDAWCNGVFLGHHEGGYTPFEFDLTDALGPPDESGERLALLVLRVEDPMDNHEQPVGKQWRWYTSTSGIWQTVFIEPRGAEYIDCFRITTDVERKTVSLAVNCRAHAGEIQAHITAPDRTVQDMRFPLRGGLAEGQAVVENPFLWNPNHPHLYQVRLELHQNGTVSDTVRTYFGMRRIDAEPGRGDAGPAVLRLNGVARYLRGALYQSYFPAGVYTATDIETLINDITLAKKFGFNFLRVHIKIDDPLLLYHADRLGMLLMCDFPNFGEGGDTPLGRQRFEQMMREAIERDFNHPSIFAWCIFNETWGFGGQLELLDILADPRRKRTVTEKQTQEARKRIANLQAHEWVQRMWQLAKQLDPTRMVEDMSVVHWEHLDYFAHGRTDINSWHFYLHDYEQARDHINKIVSSSYLGSGFNYVPGYQNSGEPLINSEYGGVSCMDGDRDVSWSFKFLTNELRRHKEISAYIYTELHDVEWERNGFLNYDRTPKEFGYDPRIINESNTLPIDAPPARRVKPWEIVRLDVASSHFSSAPHHNVSLEWRLAGVDTRGRFHRDLGHGLVPIPFPQRQVVHACTLEVPVPAFPCICELRLVAHNGEGDTIACNFTHLHVSAGYPPAREELDRALALRKTPAEWSACEWSLGSQPREVQAAADVAYGMGDGFFEWHFEIPRAELDRARHIRVLCEVASHRIDTPQTDGEVYRTALLILLNGVRVYETVLRNQPHDARGVLSYLRDRPGDYGYLIHGFAEGALLQEIVSQVGDGGLRLRLGVPADALAKGGLTVYGAETGRFPVCPTVVLEW